MTSNYEDLKSRFFFADQLVLDDSPTRNFYKQLLQGLIHKNNNMLGVVQGFSSLILMEDHLANSIRENVEQMKDSAQSASDLSKVILVAAGCATVTPEEMNLGELLPYLEETARSICDKHRVPLRVNTSQGLPPIKADTTRLSEVLTELIKNAAEAAVDVDGGEVAIDILGPGEATPAEEKRVDIFVRNTGKDIPAEKLAKIFTPFNSGKDGTHYGIGLTTAGVLAGQMKMRLGIRSADGTTTAWLSVPAV